MLCLPPSTFHYLNPAGTIFNAPNPDPFSIHCSLLSITYAIAGGGGGGGYGVRKSPINLNKLKLFSCSNPQTALIRVLALMWFTRLCSSSKLLFNPFPSILSWFSTRGHTGLLLLLNITQGPQGLCASFLPTRTPNLDIHRTHAWASFTHTS